MHRRQVLASAGALLAVPLAGCVHPSNVLDMREATPEALSDEMSRSVSPGTVEHATVQEAIENGAATVSATSPPVRTDEPIRFQGRYYEASATEVGSRERTRYDIRIDYDPEPTETNQSIAYAALPAVDKTALDGVIPPQGDTPESDGFEVGTLYIYPENATNASLLVPTQQYDLVRHRGSAYRVQIRAETVTEVEYRYEVAEIAANTGAFADRLRSTYQFTLSELSPAEREIVEEAIDSGYFDGATDAFRSVTARFHAHRGLETSDAYGTWLLEYQDVPYIAYAEFPPDVTAAR